MSVRATVDVSRLAPDGFGNRSLMYWGTLGMCLIEGTVSVVPAPVENELVKHTQRGLELNRLTPRLARRLELLVLDVDGVLTDGGLWFGARGEALKRFHVRDGHGIKLLMATGMQVALISGRRSAAVRTRCRVATSGFSR